MKSYNCPVCNKSGLEDFRKKKIECPGCGSDLGVFAELKSSTFVSKKINIAIFSMFCIACALIIYLTLSLVRTKENLQLNLDENVKLLESIVKNREIIIQLNDSIESILQSNPDNQYVDLYIVERGDSFCKISYILFGTEKYAEDIAELNGKSINSLIFPDTKLLIPQKK